MRQTERGYSRLSAFGKRMEAQAEQRRQATLKLRVDGGATPLGERPTDVWRVGEKTTHVPADLGHRETRGRKHPLERRAREEAEVWITPRLLDAELVAARIPYPGERFEPPLPVRGVRHCHKQSATSLEDSPHLPRSFEGIEKVLKHFNAKHDVERLLVKWELRGIFHDVRLEPLFARSFDGLFGYVHPDVGRATLPYPGPGGSPIPASHIEAASPTCDVRLEVGYDP